ncbi:MAG TPA: EamA family transporter [Actinomycetota bacterium]|nr:EamA family transporter [Actinomycetota bacterium]
MERDRKMLRTAAVALLSVLLATGGQLLLKSGMTQVGYIGKEKLGSPVKLVLHVLTTPQVLLGLLLFVFSAAVWLVVLSRVPLSFAYPFVGITYVLTTLFARFVLHEHVPSLRWVGLALIVSGILIIGRTAPDVDSGPAASSMSTPD